MTVRWLRSAAAWVGEPRSERALTGPIAVAAAGFIVLLLTWAKVSGTVDLPAAFAYLASGVPAGLGLVAAGIAATVTTVRRRDAAAQVDRMAAIRKALVGVREHVERERDDTC